MKFVAVLITVISLMSCATHSELAKQDECEDENRDRAYKDKAQCGATNDVITAISSDAEIAKEIVDIVKDEFFPEESKDALAHDGEDSNLCPEGKKKVCSHNDGCSCRDL